MNTQEAVLARGATQLGLDLSQEQLGLLLQYFQELHRWNRKVNLSGIRDYGEMLTVHGLDSLSVHSWIQGHSVIDVGTGGGLPGIVLSIVFPEKSFLLLDSNGKKIRFLTHVVTLLGLQNVQVVQARSEDYQAPAGFDVVICRAFATLNKILSLSAHLCGPDGVILAMKGRYPTEELSELPAHWSCSEVQALTVPQVNGARHLVVMRRKSEA